MLVVVYMGAVMVLFLFVVMMLDIRIDRMQRVSGNISLLRLHCRCFSGSGNGCGAHGRFWSDG